MPEATTDSYAAEIREFIETSVLFGDSGSLRDDDSLIETAVLDSTGVLEVITFLEDRYSISFDDSELVASNFESIARIAAFVASKTK